MTAETINLRAKLAQFTDHWAPRVVAEMNDYQFKLVKFQGDFVWHRHEDTDEVFLVLDGELFVVPNGVEHITRARAECSAMLIEPRGVPNTGTAGGARTAENDAWI